LLLMSRHRVRGAFNVVGSDVLPWSYVLARLGRIALPLPSAMGASLLSTLWSAQLIDMPAAYLKVLQWTIVADGHKLHAATGFVPQHNIDDILREVGAL
jgi:UDP-glucose 4-epimerase